MPAFIEKVERHQDSDLWCFHVLVKCNFGRRPDRSYVCFTADNGETFVDKSNGQLIADASFVSRLRERLKVELAKSKLSV